MFVAMLIVILIALLFPLVPPVHESPKRVTARQDVIMIREALKQYIVEFGTAPVGNHAQIMTALRGKNPKQIIIFEADAKRFNPRGEFLDPWGTPYRIEASNIDFPWAYSFGKNLIDEGGAEFSDDIVSWR
ncbi:MAG: hypothetical protein QOE70_3464 [Chthoniobacter sp.]|jgi:type II secretory pathway pseudopilin PulG|nr:hypothetical protein [Chthoniobacter sp.]